MTVSASAVLLDFFSLQGHSHVDDAFEVMLSGSCESFYIPTFNIIFFVCSNLG